MKKKGWFGDPIRHSRAARLGWRRRRGYHTLPKFGQHVQHYNTSAQEATIAHLKNEREFGDYWVEARPDHTILVHTDKHIVYMISPNGRYEIVTPRNYTYFDYDPYEN